MVDAEATAPSLLSCDDEEDPDLATKVATADGGSKAFKELDSAASDLGDEITKAASDLNSSIGG